MYLAPLNYDRYFKKVFSELKIAKRFLEDFLDVEITKIEHLDLKKSVTDASRYVEFDFRCEINKKQVIIEMQQWYKPDVVQRFYMYHSLGTSLQLEKLPKKNLLIPNEQVKSVKDYRSVMPIITLVWLVDDTLGFSDDYIAFVPTPEQIPNFIKNVGLWKNPDVQQVMEERSRLLEILKNDTKNVDWLYENKLIYAFQKNIVRNKKFKKYYAWFELAQKTLDKISDKFAYSEYEQDEILSEVVRRLKKHLENPSSIEYITNYDSYREGILRYEKHIRNDGKKAGREETEKKLLPIIEQKDKELDKKKQELNEERQKTINILRSLGLKDEEIAVKMNVKIEAIKNK